MTVFRLNDEGGRDELLTLARRLQGSQRRFTQITARGGCVLCEGLLSRDVLAFFDMTPAEAFGVADALVEAAEHASVQAQEADAQRRAEACQRRQASAGKHKFPTRRRSRE